jgi:hypothetical protein
MDVLDIRILSFLGFGSAVLLAVGMHLANRVSPDNLAVRAWMRGATLHAMCYAVIYLRDVVPLPQIFFILLLNVCTVVGGMQIVLGLRHHLGLGRGFRWDVPLIGVAVLGNLFFTYGVPSLMSRVVLASLLVAAMYSLGAQLLLTSKAARRSPDRGMLRVLGCLALSACTVFVLRALWTPTYPEARTLLELTQPIHKLAFLATIIVHLVQTVGFMYLAIAQRERAWREGEHRYRDLVEQSVDGIFLIDAQGRFLDSNTAGAAMLGYTRGELLGLRFVDVVTEDERQRIPEEMARYADVDIVRTQWRLERKDGSRLTAEVQGRRLSDGRMQGIARDITEQRAAAEAMRKAKEAAEASNRAKSDFLANVSHEIRTPMNAIVGYANILKMDATDVRQLARLEKISTAAGHLLGLINDVLDLSRIDSGQLTLEQIKLDVRQIGQQVQAVLAEQVALKSLSLRIEHDTSIPDSLIGDPARLTQAFLNLAGHAVQFTDQGEVALRVRMVSEVADAVVLRFEVQESGKGLSEEAQARLFLPFQQADDKGPRLHGEASLGLVVTKCLAEHMGGQVGLSSEPDVGSTFWFTVQLPKAVPERKYVDVRQSAEFNDAYLADLRRSVGGVRVLLVEDDEMSQEVARVMLESIGLKVDLAVDGREALDKIQAAESPSCYGMVLMDIQMAHMDGLQATRAIRAMPGYGTVPIVAISANTSIDDQRRAMSAGMNDFISKPVAAEKLYAVVRKWVGAAVPA